MRGLNLVVNRWGETPDVNPVKYHQLKKKSNSKAVSSAGQRLISAICLRNKVTIIMTSAVRKSKRVKPCGSHAETHNACGYLTTSINNPPPHTHTHRKKNPSTHYYSALKHTRTDTQTGSTQEKSSCTCFCKHFPSSVCVCVWIVYTITQGGDVILWHKIHT